MRLTIDDDGTGVRQFVSPGNGYAERRQGETTERPPGLPRAPKRRGGGLGLRAEIPIMPMGCTNLLNQ